MFGFLSQGVIGDILAPVKSPGQQLHQAIDDNLVDKAMRLIREEQVDFNFRDHMRDNAVPLHTAAKAGNQTLVDFLLDMGVPLQVKDGTGNTPLHYAAKAGRVDLVKYLVSKGADVACRNNHRHTAYDVATNHIIRQYLLPLQLRAEPQPEPDALSAVHNPDIVRDYSNLPPPPTSFPAQAFAAPPTHYAVQRPTTWTDPAVTRPIAADGFHSSAGDPKLAEKYGHTKSEINIAPPPATRPDGQPRGPPQPVPQFSAFAHGRPMARYVAYNAVDNQPVPWQQPPSGYAASPPPPQQAQVPYPGAVAPAPLPHPHHASPPLPATTAAIPPPPPPPPMMAQALQPGQATSPVLMYAPPQPPAPRPQQTSPFQPIAVQPMSAPAPTAVPRLPSPNRVSVFQPQWGDGDDAVQLS